MRSALTELRREIELIDPTIIVCGYTITSLNIILGYNIKDRQNSNLYYFTRLNGHDVIVLTIIIRQIVIQI